MSIRRFHAPPNAISARGKSLILSADETRHARDVLRLQPGEEVHVFDGEGREYRCVIGQVHRDSAKLDLIEEVKPVRRESPLQLTLYVALLKGEKFDLVVQKATELGVVRLVPVVTGRADVKIRSDADARKKISRWQRIALEATKQCGRALLMKIDPPAHFGKVIESRAESLRLMFAERKGSPLSEAVENSESTGSELAALIGPEGGWSDDEIDQARNHGWKIVTLGGRTLRAETAAVVVAALLQHRFGDLL